MEYSSFISVYEAVGNSNITIGIRVICKKEVNGDELQKAVDKAMHRFPYYKRKLLVQNNRISVEANEKPVVVYKKEGEPHLLACEEVNDHLCSVQYYGNEIVFYMSHILAGGCGTFPWVITCMYQYISQTENIYLDVPGLYHPDGLPGADERKFPSLEELPDAAPMHEYNYTDSYFPVEDYMLSMKDPAQSDNKYTSIKVKVSDILAHNKTNDGSPASLLAILLLRSLRKVCSATEKPVLSIKIAHNSRADLGCPNTTCDLTRAAHLRYTGKIESWDTEKQCTCARGMIIAQTMPENSIADAKYDLNRLIETEKLPTIQDKIEYNTKNRFSTVRVMDTCTVSYTGKMEWGDLCNYIDEVSIMTGGHIMIEVSHFGDVYFISFQELLKDRPYLKNFLDEFDKEGIPYEIAGVYKRELPEISKQILV